MGFSHLGSIATPQLSPSPLFLKGFLVTSTEGHEISHIFEKLQISLELLEKQNSGSEQDLKQLYPCIEWLPRMSEERLECDIRIRAIKKKWGIMAPYSSPHKQKNEKPPLTIGNLEEIMIELNHVDYMNSGKEGREWIKKQLNARRVLSFKTETEMVGAVEKLINELNLRMINITKADTVERLKNMFEELSLAEFSSLSMDQKYEVVEKWLRSRQNAIPTISMLSNQLLVFSNEILKKAKSTFTTYTLN